MLYGYRFFLCPFVWCLYVCSLFFINTRANRVAAGHDTLDQLRPDFHRLLDSPVLDYLGVRLGDLHGGGGLLERAAL